MAEESVSVGPVRLVPRTDSRQFRQLADQARLERRAQAAAEAAGLFQLAGAARADAEPVWLRAVALLIEDLKADQATVTIVRGEDARRCRISRGRERERRPSRRWPGQPQLVAAPALAATRVEIDALRPGTTAIPSPGDQMPGATSSFHALLYTPGSAQPLGCLSLYSSSASAVATDRVAFMDAFAALLAPQVAQSPLPDPSPA
jgi:hypothetical protein